MTVDDVEFARRVQAVFDAALDIEPHERAAFLAASCAGDPGLRSAVEALLVAHESADTDQLLPALELPATAPGLVGQRLGPYALLSEIGEGGMGSVYLAEREDVGLRVAVKLVRYGRLAARQHVERFLLERRVLARLQHPSIARLLDAGVTEDGLPYLVMEYVEGERIDRYCDGHDLTVEARLRLLVQVCAAVEYAHGRSVIHRDIKPANVLVTALGEVKLLDFGIAKLLVESEAEARAVTRTGTLLATPEYASPEQVRGEPVGPASDVYSLGVLLRGLVRGVARPAADLTAILETALEEEPARRYASPAELRADIERHLAGEAVRSPAAAPGRRAARWLRGPGARSAGVAGVALVLFGLAGFLFRTRATAGDVAGPNVTLPAQAASPATVAVLPFAVHGSAELAYLRDGLVDLVGRALDGAGELRSVDARAVLTLADGEADPPLEAGSGGRLALRAGAGLFVLGQATEVAGRLRLSASLYEASSDPRRVAAGEVEGPASELFDLVDGLAVRLLADRLDGPGERIARTAATTTGSLPALKAFLEGESHHRRARYDDAVAAFQRAVALDSTFALAYYRLAQAATSTGLAEEGRRAREAAARHSRGLAPRDSLLIEAYRASHGAGDAERAEALYRNILVGYPDDIEATFQLADLQFHTNPYRGRSIREARVGLTRSLPYPHMSREAADHLLRVLMLEDDRQAFDRVLAQIAAANPADPLVLAYGPLFRAGRWGDATDRERALAAVGDLIDRRLLMHVWLLGTFTKEFAMTADLARRMLGPERPPELRAWGHLTLADLALARGQPGRASEELERAARHAPLRALEVRAHHAVLPHVQVVPDRLSALRDSLLRWDPAAAEVASSPPFDEFYPGGRDAVRLYVLGLLSVRLGDADAALAFARDLDAVSASPSATSIARMLAAGVRAHLAWADRRPGQVLALLEEAGTDLPRPYQPVHLATQAPERFLRAEALRALGRYDEALGWYGTLEELTIADFVYLGPVYQARAEIYEATGRPDLAADAWARLVELWRDCEPGLVPAREEAERRLARLSSGAGAAAPGPARAAAGS